MTKTEDPTFNMTARELAERRLQAELVIACDEWEAIQARFDKVLQQGAQPTFALMREFCEKRGAYLKAKRTFDEFQAS